MYNFALYRPKEGIVEQGNLSILDCDKMFARRMTENEVPSFMFEKITAQISTYGLKDFSVWQIEHRPEVEVIPTGKLTIDKSDQRDSSGIREGDVLILEGESFVIAKRLTSAGLVSVPEFGWQHMREKYIEQGYYGQIDWHRTVRSVGTGAAISYKPEDKAPYETCYFKDERSFRETLKEEREHMHWASLGTCIYSKELERRRTQEMGRDDR